VPVGLARRGWASSEPVREIFRHAFAAAGLPYFNPHALRSMLVRHAMTLDLSPEGMKAWSQNLGHADVLTTLTSYGAVPVHRQGELIQNSGRKRIMVPDMRLEEIAMLEAFMARVKGSKDAA
jgi:hypothetical protein